MMKKKLKKGHLNILFGRLKESRRVIGPKIEQGVYRPWRNSYG
jgi:hypothetical protein